MKPVPKGQSGTLWFKSGTPQFEYFNDTKRRRKALADGTMSTVGDVGYVDDDGYLYLTDRATFMIISGGVNIYPQECETCSSRIRRSPTPPSSACRTRISAKK